MRGSDTCELVFENCEVPAENVLGEARSRLRPREGRGGHPSVSFLGLRHNHFWKLPRCGLPSTLRAQPCCGISLECKSRILVQAFLE